MPCTPFQLPDGARGFICTRGPRRKSPRCTECAGDGLYLCDAKVGRRKTCDAPACAAHCVTVGDDRHYCLAHAAAPGLFDTPA